jgi:maltose-binding protein MalE
MRQLYFGISNRKKHGLSIHVTSLPPVTSAQCPMMYRNGRMMAAKSANARIAQKIAENITLPKAMRRPQPGQVAACLDT